MELWKERFQSFGERYYREAMMLKAQWLIANLERKLDGADKRANIDDGVMYDNLERILWLLGQWMPKHVREEAKQDIQFMQGRLDELIEQWESRK